MKKPTDPKHSLGGDAAVVPFGLSYGTERTSQFWLGSGTEKISRKKALTEFRQPGSLVRALVARGGHGGGPTRYDTA